MYDETITLKLDGMICPSCEDEVCSALLHTRGIIDADASYRKSEVTIKYNPDIVDIEKIKDVLSSSGYSEGNGKGGIISDIISAVAVLVLFFAIPFLTSLIHIPHVEYGASFISLFLIGLLTGVHCIGMCGGIMLTCKGGITYNLFRLLSYTLMGAVFGLTGKIFSYDSTFQSMLHTMCGIAVLIAGLIMWGVPFLRNIAPAFIKPCSFKGGSALVGLLTGLMPCGALSAMWAFSASTLSPLNGAVSMFAFGLGTCIFMIIFSLFGIFIPKKYNKYLLRTSTVLIVALGLILIKKGLVALY